jgi:pimeloyl-ACP methyl ester carboxylesterase
MIEPLAAPPVDVRIQTPRGGLFARVWTPEAATGAAPIVLLHDSLGCVELWRALPERLATETGRVVVAYDRLGFGRSDAFTGTWSFDFIREEATIFFPHLREQLSLDRFVAMGHSVGGCMAALCAAEHPEGGEALITESSQAYVEDRTIAGIREAETRFLQGGQLSRLEKYHGDKARFVLEAWTETWTAPEFQGWRLDADLPRVACPALVLHGDQDEYASVAQAENIAGAIAGPTRLVILPGTRHVPHREGEAGIVSRVRDFLATTSEAR